MTQLPIAVLGTGMAGFGAGYVLHAAGTPFVCYDKNGHYGGHARSIRYASGFVFDEGVHISFTKNESVKSIFAQNVGGQYEERRFPIDNYWRGHRIEHPVQSNLHGLPVDLRVKIISDFVEARAHASAVGAAGNQPKTYADWLHAAYGKTFAETFPIAYGNKYHTTTMDQLTTEWVGPRMYRPSLEDVLRGALADPNPETHYIQSFRYPSNGGFGRYLEAFANRFDVRLQHRLVGLDPRARLLRFENGETQRYSAVISSIPLPELIPLIDGAPDAVVEAARRLAFTNVVLFNIGLDRADVSQTATTYFYDEDVIISRVSIPHLLAPSNVPAGCGAIQAEVYFSDKYKPLDPDPASLSDRVLSDLRRCGFIKQSDKVLLMDTVFTKYANVIYDFDRSAAVSTIHAFLDDAGIHYCGRYGNWDHAWTDEAFVSGQESAKRVLTKRA